MRIWALHLRLDLCVQSYVRYMLGLLGLVLSATLAAQTTNLKIISWNIKDFGQTKTDEQIGHMAHILKDYDVIAIQEVVAKHPGGAQAVARLADALDRKGADFDYRISDPTNSTSGQVSERYAFIWRTSAVKLRGRPTLLIEYDKSVDREPYLAEFVWGDKHFRILTMHLRPHDKRPEQEFASMRGLMDCYADMPLLVAGDFNLTPKHTVWNPWIKKGYRMATQSATTLRHKIDKDGDAYAHAIDNILVPTHQVNLREGGLLDIYGYFRGDLVKSRSLSDHAPVYAIIEDL